MDDDVADRGVRHWLDGHRLINAAGTMTVLGASSVGEVVADAIRQALPRFLDVAEPERFASATIGRATGAEAGCATSSAASGSPWAWPRTSPERTSA